MTKKTAQKPPDHLRQATKKWFSVVVAEFDLEQHHLMLLTRCSEAWDRGEEAREALALHGLTYTDRFGSPRARREVAIERDCRTSVARLIREKDLDCGTPADPKRPPALHSNRRS